MNLYKSIEPTEITQMVWHARMKRCFESMSLGDDQVAFDLSSDPVAVSALFSEFIPCMNYIEARYKCNYLFQELRFEYLVDLALPLVMDLESYKFTMKDFVSPEGLSVSITESRSYNDCVFHIRMEFFISSESVFSNKLRSSLQIVRSIISQIVLQMTRIWIPDFTAEFRYTYKTYCLNDEDFDDFPFVPAADCDGVVQISPIDIVFATEKRLSKKGLSKHEGQLTMIKNLIFDAMVHRGVDQSDIDIDCDTVCNVVSAFFGQHVPGLMYRINYQLNYSVNTNYLGVSAILSIPAFDGGDSRHLKALIGKINETLGNSSVCWTQFLGIFDNQAKWEIVLKNLPSQLTEAIIFERISCLKTSIGEVVKYISRHCLELYEEGELSKFYTFALLTDENLLFMESHLL